MPQVLKEELRGRILEAALGLFAERGLSGTAMGLIAERAGLGTATLYRYYPGKAELFDAVVPPELAAELERLLERRLKALGRGMLRSADSGAPRSDEADALLEFWVRHRLQCVVLLDRAEGTAYAHFGERFVALLTASVTAHLRELRPGHKLSAPRRFVLERLFENTRRTLAAILEAHADERALRAAVAAIWSYQLPGLRGFVEAQLAPHEATEA